MHSNIAIFGDNVTARNHPDWISQSDLGPAWRTNDNFNVRWDILCATQPEHRAEQLDYIEDVATEKPRNMAKQHPLRRPWTLHMPALQRTPRKKRLKLV